MVVAVAVVGAGERQRPPRRPRQWLILPSVGGWDKGPRVFQRTGLSRGHVSKTQADSGREAEGRRREVGGSLRLAIRGEA